MDFHMIYRAKSEVDLSTYRPMDRKNMHSSLHTSLNCLPSQIKPIKSRLNESITEENSLIWDNFLTLEVDSDIGNDADTKVLSNQLCYFGDDYSLHLNEMNITESEQDSNIEMQKKMPNKNAAKVEKTLSSSESLQKESIEKKRVRRSRKKRTRNISNASTTSDQSSKSSLSTAATASDSQQHCESMLTNQSNDEFTPETTISYNSNEKQFELHTKGSNAPKKMKINEMRPEDFFDIVKICHAYV